LSRRKHGDGDRCTRSASATFERRPSSGAAVARGSGGAVAPGGGLGVARGAALYIGWCFLAGVVAGAPSVALIGGFSVAHLLGGGRAVAVSPPRR
jgi:hypothetical protein